MSEQEATPKPVLWPVPEGTPEGFEVYTVSEKYLPEATIETRRERNRVMLENYYRRVRE